MPKLNESKEAIDCKKLRASIRYYMAYYGITATELALCARIGLSTLYNRFNRPECFTLGELQRVAAKFKLTSAAELLKEIPIQNQQVS